MLVKRYQGQPVKRMRRTPTGLRLILLSPRAGAVGATLTVTQRQWQAHGTVTYEPDMTLARLRALASSAAS